MTAFTTFQSSSILDVLLRDLLTLAFPLLLIGIALGDVIVKQGLRPIRTWYRRSHLATELGGLDERLLADIGLDRIAVAQLKSGMPVTKTAPATTWSVTPTFGERHRHPPMAA
ncbi:MAG TPA: DUF1127 domain-containing protein [Stellaceae bacterium]|nr:DUF1127 domain-containing protein [Stellaceae bacterium]